MDDSASVISGTSVTNQKMECPECKKEVQSRVIFNHIMGTHPGYFQQQTTKQWLENAATGQPLKIFWEVKNDFDESEIKTIYGCLSSKKTFQTEHKAHAHFKKNPKDLKEHNKQVTLFLAKRKEALRIEAAKNAKLDRSDYQSMKDSNDPELLDVLTQIVNNLFLICEMLCKDCQDLNSTYTTEDPDLAHLRKMTVPETITLFHKIKETYDTTTEKTFKFLSNTRSHLHRILKIRRFLNGYACPEKEYPWYQSPDHPNGLLIVPDSRMSEILFPFETVNHPIDWN